MGKIDLRIIKTKKNIYSAFIELMGEKTFEEIRVSEICDRALINRSTFYSHFDDKYALLDSMVLDLKNGLIAKLDLNTFLFGSKDYYMQVIKILLDEIEVNKELLKKSMVNNKDSIAMDIIYFTVKDVVYKSVENVQGVGVPIDFSIRFYLGGLYVTCLEWIKDEIKCSKDDIINYVDRMIDKNLFITKK